MGKRRAARVPPPALPPTLHGALPDVTLDLHGLYTSQAALRVEALLETWARRQPGAVLRIVTGKGNRSAEGPVLLGAVEEILRADPRVGELVLDAGGGCWLVRVR
ncbi:MAG: Smr/MutS family protein [Longimicrobiales bacterium]|nr:Smr/MutS family protein [Longimicrobiales bacterium]